MQNKQGFSIILLIAIGAIVATFGWIAYATWQQSVDDSNFTLTLPFVKHKVKKTNANSAANTNSAVNTNTNSIALPSSSFSYQTVRVGDRIGAMAVTKVEPFRADRHDVTPNKRVTFSGETTIIGTVDARFSEFGGSNQVCVTDLNVDSLKLIPKAIEDTRTVSFCFSNSDEALKTFPLGTNTIASVTMRNYNLVAYPSEVLNTSVFIRGEISTVDWKTYTNATYDFSFQYQNTWAITDLGHDLIQLKDVSGNLMVSAGPRLRNLDYDYENTLPKAIASSVGDTTMALLTVNKVSLEKITDTDRTLGYYSQWEIVTSDKTSQETRADFESKFEKTITTKTGHYHTVFSLVAQQGLHDPGLFRSMASTFTFDETLGWKMYTNTRFGYSMKYPADYTATNIDLGSTIEKGQLNGNPYYRVGVNVYSDPITLGGSGSDIYTWAKNGFHNDANIEKLHANLRQEKIGSITYWASDGDLGSTPILEYMVFHNNKLYVLTDDREVDKTIGTNRTIIFTFTFAQ